VQGDQQLLQHQEPKRAEEVDRAAGDQRAATEAESAGIGKQVMKFNLKFNKEIDRLNYELSFENHFSAEGGYLEYGPE
jgi:hypothetical protein